MVRIYRSVIAVLFLSLVGVTGFVSAQVRHADYDAIREAVDRRDTESPLLAAAVDAGDHDALRLWGLNGIEACPMIRPYLANDNEKTIIAALAGLANCRDTEAFAVIYPFAAASQSPAVQAAAYKAFAFTTAEVDRHKHAELVAQAMKRSAPHTVKAAALYGLMQSITYSGLSPADLPEMDFGLLLEDAAAYGPEGLQAAYLLARLSGLNAVYTPDAVAAALDSAASDAQKYVLARVLTQFGDAAGPLLVELASNADPLLAMSALRGLGQLSDQDSMDLIVKTLGYSDAAFRHMAVTALAARDPADSAITERFAALTRDQNSWVAVTGLRGLMQRAPDQALPVAQMWIAGDDYYRAFVALGMLAGTEKGKVILSDYAVANPGTIRGREAAIALDPAIEAIRQPRETPSASLLQSYAERTLVLKTTRGTICIAPIADAPYAAANFMLLADAGKLDGMLWHRVIPNFVTQAGQSEDFSLASWGTIREEWSGQSHEVGTVGVATAGPDTGSAQFFINTAHNLHLNGRYTVFGQVITGMDVTYALQEGDLIEQASTAAVREAACN